MSISVNFNDIYILDYNKCLDTPKLFFFLLSEEQENRNENSRFIEAKHNAQLSKFEILLTIM